MTPSAGVTVAPSRLICCGARMPCMVTDEDFSEFECPRCGRIVWIYPDGPGAVDMVESRHIPEYKYSVVPVLHLTRGARSRGASA